MRLVDVLGIHLETATDSPVVILREHASPHRYLPIFVGAAEATAIALAVAGAVAPRPLTHDLLVALVAELGGAVDGVEITEVRDGAFIARLDVHGPAGRRSLDTRPSDAIALAVRTGAPVYVDDAVLDEAGALVDESDDETPDLPTEAEIDEEVAAFRAVLDGLDPTDFAGDDHVASDAGDVIDLTDAGDAGDDEDER